MAFTKLNSKTEAIKIKKGTVVTGHLTGCRVIPSKKKGEKDSVLLLLTDKKSGQPIEVWANGVMKYQLLNEKGNGIKDELRGILFRFTGGNKEKIEGRQSPMQNVDIEMDASDKIKGGKDYVLDRTRKFDKKKAKK